jgi:Icc-related predicted phosphoesterase
MPFRNPTRSIRRKHEPTGWWGTLVRMNAIAQTTGSTRRPRTGHGVRVAAIGDLHVGGPGEQPILPDLAQLHRRADLLIVAGDLTENGRVPEAEAAAQLFARCRLPVVAVLGNHDLRSIRRVAFRETLERAGIELLAGSATVVVLRDGTRVGIAGTTGCGGGFWPVEGPDAVHARTFKRLALRARRESHLLEQALLAVDADVWVAATHFAPTASTLGSEPLAKYWMLGNCELGAAIDRRRPDLVVHGHAHLGTLRGTTPGGVPVRNVALPVVGRVHIEELRTIWSSADSVIAGAAATSR